MICEYCKQNYTIIYGSGRFCCQKCARVFSSMQHREETNKKISVKLKGRTSCYAGKMFDKENNIWIINPNANKRYCKTCGKDLRHVSKYGYCRKCFDKTEICSKIRTNTIRQAMAKGKHKGWASRKIKSFAERYTETWLNTNGMSGFKINEPVLKKSLGINEPYNYFLDFYFPNKNVVLEIDGKQHNTKERTIHDYIRDMRLLNVGYKVYRIKWTDINNKKKLGILLNDLENFKQYFLRLV